MKSENSNNINHFTIDKMRHFIKILSFVHPALKFVIYCFCFLLLIGNYSLLIESGNWYQQFMQALNGQSINDITFTDSLNGYAITNFANGHSYILKTTNSGDNWTIIYDATSTNYLFTRIRFLNQNTGFVGGLIYQSPFYYIFKTTNGGMNWFNINAPFQSTPQDDIYALNDSTIWAVFSSSFAGGVFRTTNGGVNWIQQLSLGSENPDHIYMYNARIGFVTENNNYIRKTEDSGQSWFIISNPLNRSFVDMFFIDSLKGWLAFDSVRKTTDGGLNWQTQVLPYGGHMGGFLNYSYIFKFSYINKDTIWGAGGRIAFPNTQLRGLIYRTTNGGSNWQFQLPDTSINIGQYLHIKFINKNTGWAYGGPRGIHTTNGGDTTWLLGIKQISSEIPKEFKLCQNYPNPFNPNTVISYQLEVSAFVNLEVYDITGKHIIDLVNQKQNAGTYEVDFSGRDYSSGIYFYSLIVDNKLIETKKMILIK